MVESTLLMQRPLDLASAAMMPSPLLNLTCALMCMLCAADFVWTKHDVLGHSEWEKPILHLSQTDAFRNQSQSKVSPDVVGFKAGKEFSAATRSGNTCHHLSMLCR